MKEKSEFRVETDLLGDVEIPSTAYWGIRTARANLSVSRQTPHPKFIEALVILKRGALGSAPAPSGKNRDVREAVLSSCSEILEGKLQTNIIADPYFCDAGIAINTNVNEVIANRAEEMLGGNIGTYARVNPDADIDLHPGTFEMELRNAARIALLLGFKDLEPIILDLERWFRRKSLECEQIIHSSDSGNGAWRTLSPEFNTCGTVIERCHRRLLESTVGLQEVSLSYINIESEDKNLKHETWEKELVDAICKTAGVLLHVGEDKSLHGNSMSEFLQFSSALKELAVELSVVCRNLYASCSKFNASLDQKDYKQNGNRDKRHTLKHMSDLLSLSACQVIANDFALSQCCQVTEVPASLPFAVNSLLQSLDLLQTALDHFNLWCAIEFSA